jgi:hypothetical protein
VIDEQRKDKYTVQRYIWAYTCMQFELQSVVQKPKWWYHPVIATLRNILLSPFTAAATVEASLGLLEHFE